ncbi:MAG: DUF1134 domain-containing protein [Allosphingosinicella sp.]|uniref:DUF1134 domain-containing protein n=1 Tax=Allosphingosinicella sp. TaxID=2823234 RepID=UPI00395E7D3C
MKRAFVHLAALAAFVSLPGIASAQVQNVDPDTGAGWSTPAEDPYAEQQPATPPAGDEWTPLGTAEEEAAAATSTPVETTPAVPPAQTSTTTPTARNETVPREDIFAAAEGVFGRGAEGLAGILEDILRDQGEPIAYIAGQEASGAFILGARWGSGVMRHQIEGDRVVYWTGPSIGFDAGADASKVFILVYNLYDGQDLFRRYPGGEGRAYLVGGFSANYLRRGDVVLIPVRLGVGARLGVNVGYMRFSERNRWLPF